MTVRFEAIGLNTATIVEEDDEPYTYLDLYMAWAKFLKEQENLEVCPDCEGCGEGGLTNKNHSPNEYGNIRLCKTCNGRGYVNANT